MKRIWLPELEDQAWLPKLARDFATDYLRVVMAVGRPYDVVLPKLYRILRQGGYRSVLDLCSGGGGPVCRLMTALRARRGTSPHLTLSDLYPNARAFELLKAAGQCDSFVIEPVNAVSETEDVEQLRTMFTAFHHLTDDDARAFVRHQCERGTGFAVFEITDNTIGAHLRVFVLSALIFLVTPFLRPWSVKRLLLTYMCPIVPVVVFWDGIASNFKSFSEREFRALLEPSQNALYHVQCGRLRSSLMSHVTYFVALPRR